MCAGLGGGMSRNCTVGRRLAGSRRVLRGLADGDLEGVVMPCRGCRDDRRAKRRSGRSQYQRQGLDGPDAATIRLRHRPLSLRTEACRPFGVRMAYHRCRTSGSFWLRRNDRGYPRKTFRQPRCRLSRSHPQRLCPSIGRVPPSRSSAAGCGAGIAVRELPPQQIGLAGYFRKVGDPDETVLAGEDDGAVAALRLGDAEDTVMAGIVDRDRAVVVDHQPAGIRKDRVPEIVLHTDGARFSEAVRPPIR